MRVFKEKGVDQTNKTDERIFHIILKYHSLDNVDATIKFIPKVEVRKGKQHLRVSDLILDFGTTR